MPNYYHPDRDFYVKKGVTPPTAQPHGISDTKENPLSESDQMQRATPTNWRQQGNELIADTPLGRLVQIIPSDMLLAGTDEKGLPILQRVVL